MRVAAELENVGFERLGSRILSDVTLTFDEGQHWVLLGPNGAGKTTVAKLIAAREFPTEGIVRVLGEDTRDAQSVYLASRVGFASADVRDRLRPTDTALALVLAAAWGQTATFSETYEGSDRERAQDLLAALGVADLADRQFGTMSEGERQRVTIARALMSDPEIVILDEPTAGLDLGARETLVVALRDLMADPATPTMILITHELEEIAPGFTHAALLSEGRVVKSGLIEEVITGDNLTTAFGLELQVDRAHGRWWAKARTD